MPVAEHSELVVGLDIGATKTIAGLVTADGELVRSRQVATAPSAPAILCAARALCEGLIAAAEAPVLGIGIGSAGVVDTRTATVIHANDNLPGWGGTDLRALAIDGLPLVAENDVRAMAFGEARLGAGRDYDSLLCVTVGTGIGGALLFHGEIWPGEHFSAGEIGYLVIGWDGDDAVILDQYASGPGIERAWQAAAGADERLPLTDISARAYAGDAIARAVIHAEGARIRPHPGGLRHVHQSASGDRWRRRRADWPALVGCLCRCISGESAAAAGVDGAAAGRPGGGGGAAGRGDAGLAGGEQLNAEVFLAAVKDKLIVSCQALEGEPLHGAGIMARMAVAAQIGGAAAVRANGPADIRAIKQAVDLPVIGLYKQGESGVYITPTFEAAAEIAEAGADVIALDCTDRPRPDGAPLAELLARIHSELKLPIFADVASLAEARAAAAAGAAMAAPTLSGYTDARPALEGPDFELLAQMIAHLPTPVIAEGRVHRPEQARRALDMGAWAVVVGSAITRPRTITARFAHAITHNP